MRERERESVDICMCMHARMSCTSRISRMTCVRVFLALKPTLFLLTAKYLFREQRESQMHVRDSARVCVRRA